MKQVSIGLLGCGNVGSAFVSLLEQRRTTISARTGVEPRVTRAAVRSLNKDRGLELYADVYTDDAASVVEDPDVDIIVELIGGVDDPPGTAPSARSNFR